ncbi:hypothetical protein JX265_008400 [Neoarthrinium moseri]|uniref:Uncharacterized protein n=1 Tax=Neoarthrinium moseri TaxID=1658444 RepID=A0A9Q0AMK8_9PEZI|nr:hypothetical protein JX265_008400 [Neoarthrinium moseri]
MSVPYDLPAPKRITASNLPLPAPAASDETAEPGVECRDCEEGADEQRWLWRPPARSSPRGRVVLPGGLNIYYLDVAPNSEGPMGQLSLVTPGSATYSVRDGKGSYSVPVETVVGPGEVILQRGMMHAIWDSLSNRTNSWVRVLGIVASSDANRVPIDGQAEPEKYRTLEDAWLQ